MYKSLVLFCAVCLVVIEARPWQYLPAMPGYIPVYIRNGDTPLEEINPDLAEAFHALPAGRSAGKNHVEADTDSLELVEQTNQSQPESAEPYETVVDKRAYEKILLEKSKKANSEVTKPEER